MAIPGQVTNSVTYTNPGPDKSFLGNFLPVATSMLGNYQAKQAQQNEEYGKLFPVLAQMNMLAPAQKGEAGAINYPFGGQSYFKTTPSTNPDNEYRQYQILDKKTELGLVPPTDIKMQQDAINEVYKIYASSPSAPMQVDAMAKKAGVDTNTYLQKMADGIYQARKRALEPALPDVSKVPEGTILRDPSTKLPAYKKVKGAWQKIGL